MGIPWALRQTRIACIMSPPSHVIALVSPKEAAGMPLDERDDDELMLLAKNGMGPAFDALVRRHQASVLRVATKELGDLALAKDVAQTTFLEVHRYLPRYQPQQKFRAFLHRVLINQC